MKNFFRACQWKAQYYWTLLREWANHGRPRWAYSILLACALALTGCDSPPQQPPKSPGDYKHQYVALRIGADDDKIQEHANVGWTTAAFLPVDSSEAYAVVVLKKPLPVEVAKPKNGARK